MSLQGLRFMHGDEFSPNPILGNSASGDADSRKRCGDEKEGWGIYTPALLVLSHLRRLSLDVVVIAIVVVMRHLAVDNSILTELGMGDVIVLRVRAVPSFF